MQIITTREFRADEKRYFDLAERETVFVSRKTPRLIVISIAKDDFFSKAELLFIQKGLVEVKNSRTHKMQEDKSLTDFLKMTTSVTLTSLKQMKSARTRKLSLGGRKENARPH